jgi:uncharacterized protein YndB with AHSA1/START domain
MKTKITVQTTINASIKKVWEAYTNPLHIVHWNFASTDWECPSATNDLQVGGVYNARMQARDGSMGFDFKVIYDEITLHKKIAYTMEDDRKAMITFEENNHQTNVTIIFDGEQENPVEMQKGGWQAILNNFKTYTEEL